MTRTYYEIFGVNRTASSEEIRAAYLTLVKQHHPDVAAASGAKSPPGTLALLNRCYAVLRDPRKRADYDAQLEREARERSRKLPVPRQLVAKVAKRPQRQWAIPLLIAAVAATAVVAQLARLPAEDAGYGAMSLLSWGRTAAPAAPEKPLATADVEREAQLATGASTDEAISVSQRCFAAAHDDDSLSSAKLCIVFDDAFLYWRQNADNYDAMPLYFREEITHMRHLDALGGSSDDADKTLGQLRDATFRALLAQLRRESQGSAAAPPVKGQGVKAGGTAESQNETAAEKNSSESVHI